MNKQYHLLIFSFWLFVCSLEAIPLLKTAAISVRAGVDAGGFEAALNRASIPGNWTSWFTRCFDSTPESMDSFSACVPNENFPMAKAASRYSRNLFYEFSLSSCEVRSAECSNESAAFYFDSEKCRCVFDPTECRPVGAETAPSCQYNSFVTRTVTPSDPSVYFEIDYRESSLLNRCIYTQVKCPFGEQFTANPIKCFCHSDCPGAKPDNAIPINQICVDAANYRQGIIGNEKAYYQVLNNACTFIVSECPFPSRQSFLPWRCKCDCLPTVCSDEGEFLEDPVTCSCGCKATCDSPGKIRTPQRCCQCAFSTPPQYSPQLFSNKTSECWLFRYDIVPTYFINRVVVTSRLEAWLGCTYQNATLAMIKTKAQSEAVFNLIRSTNWSLYIDATLRYDGVKLWGDGTNITEQPIGMMGLPGDSQIFPNVEDWSVFEEYRGIPFPGIVYMALYTGYTLAFKPPIFHSTESYALCMKICPACSNANHVITVGKNCSCGCLLPCPGKQIQNMDDCSCACEACVPPLIPVDDTQCSCACPGCPAPKISIDDALCTCGCPKCSGAQVLMDSDICMCGCPACPAPYVISNYFWCSCECPSCDAGQVMLDENSCQCSQCYEACPEGQVTLDYSTCSCGCNSCTWPEVLLDMDNCTCGCPQCPGNQILVDQATCSCDCPACEDPTQVIIDFVTCECSNTCQACPRSSQIITDAASCACGCKPCRGAQILLDADSCECGCPNCTYPKQFVNDGVCCECESKPNDLGQCSDADFNELDQETNCCIPKKCPLINDVSFERCERNGVTRRASLATKRDFFEVKGDRCAHVVCPGNMGFDLDVCSCWCSELSVLNTSPQHNSSAICVKSPQVVLIGHKTDWQKYYLIDKRCVVDTPLECGYGEGFLDDPDSHACGCVAVPQFFLASGQYFGISDAQNYCSLVGDRLAKIETYLDAKQVKSLLVTSEVDQAFIDLQWNGQKHVWGDGSPLENPTFWYDGEPAMTDMYGCVSTIGYSENYVYWWTTTCGWFGAKAICQRNQWPPQSDGGTQLRMSSTLTQHYQVDSSMMPKDVAIIRSRIATAI